MVWKQSHVSLTSEILIYVWQIRIQCCYSDDKVDIQIQPSVKMFGVLIDDQMTLILLYCIYAWRLVDDSKGLGDSNNACDKVCEYIASANLMSILIWLPDGLPSWGLPVIIAVLAPDVENLLNPSIMLPNLPGPHLHGIGIIASCMYKKLKCQNKGQFITSLFFKQLHSNISSDFPYIPSDTVMAHCSCIFIQMANSRICLW